MIPPQQRRAVPPCRGGRHRVARDIPAVAAGRAVCAGCHELAEEALVDLAELLEGCAVTLAHFADGTTRRQLVDIQADALGTLATWCGVVAWARGLAGPDAPCVRVLTGFLAVHFDWLTAHPRAAAFTDELTELAGAVREVSRPVP